MKERAGGKEQMASQRQKAAGRDGSLALVICMAILAMFFVAVFVLLFGKYGHKSRAVTGGTAAVAAQPENAGNAHLHRFSAFVNSKDSKLANPGKLIGLTPAAIMEQFSLMTDVDPEAPIEAGGITDEFSLYSDDGELYVRVINVYVDPVCLKDCCVCSVRFTKKAGAYALAREIECGESSYQDVYDHYIKRNLYLGTSDTLVYKTNNENIRFHDTKAAGGRSTHPVIRKVNEVDGIFRFEDDGLVSYRLEAPELLYYELRNNVDLYELQMLNAAELASLRSQRDHYLEELKAAFDAAGVDVTIDETTGTVAMRSDLLFDFDSYAIKDDAKKYIDDFFSVYMSVLMREDIISSIHSVRFEGHTDTKGTYDYNKTLSLRRAQSVLDYCLNRSSLDSDQKAELSELAETFGYSYDYPVYDEAGNVNMDASRRVEVNFVIGTRYRLTDEELAAREEELDYAAESYPASGRSSYMPDQWKVAVLTDIYSDDRDRKVYELLYADTMCLLSGDKTGISAIYGPKLGDFRLSNASVGRVVTEGDAYFFEAFHAGTCHIDAQSRGAGYNGEDLKCHVTLHVLDPADELPLSLKPDKQDIRKGDTVRFELNGEYDDDIWAFAYYDGKQGGNVYGRAEWLDASTLSVDIRMPEASANSATLTIILTPAGDPDTLLGYYRGTVVK
ncbi:MAG: OmpA family protein [Lachnospiraceae bacterium]|nr:OmpA family protein [Lachnospiraceae bacterium]